VKKTTYRVAQSVIQALWVGIIPALLAALAIKVLVPVSGSGVAGLVAKVRRAYPVPMGVACFFVFTWIARHWRFSLPGGRYASALPGDVAVGERDPDRLRDWAAFAALLDLLTSKALQRRLTRTLDEPRRAELESQLARLRGGLESSEFERARAAASSLSALAAPALGAQRVQGALGALAAVAVAAGAMLGFRAKLVESYVVLSGSMLPTLEPEDRLVGRKVSFTTTPPRRGDVVVFRSAAIAALAAMPEAQPDVIVKRVIGLPGDRIGMSGGSPVINGWPVPTCEAGPYLYVVPDGEAGVVAGAVVVEFLDDRAYLTLHPIPVPRFNETYTVPPGEVFVLGDSRGNSMDSRVYGQGHGGGVPLAAIEARGDWFLVGTHRSGAADFSRFLRPIVGLQTQLRVEGWNAKDVAAGIARCFEHRPRETHPPPPAEPRAGQPAACPTAT